MINKRLFDWYGIDVSKNLKFPKICPRPFDTVLIDKIGSCYLCECTAWLPQSVGNLNNKPLVEIINSPIASLLQESIIDRSYKYCNSKQCTFLQNLSPERYHPIPPKQIKHIRLALDDSCNLSCPSCRTNQIFLKSGKLLKLRIGLANKILDFIKQQSHTITVNIGSDGDPFASLVYRYFIQKSVDLNNVRFSIQTNGLLIKKMYNRFNSMFQKLDVLNISIDGVTKNTYEKLRRGGSFEKIIENLEFLKLIKNNFNLHLHMVVQEDNWKEMPLMVELGEKFNVDKIFFNEIQDWNTSINFKEQTFKNNQEYQSLINNLRQKDLVFNPKKIYPWTSLQSGFKKIKK